MDYDKQRTHGTGRRLEKAKTMMELQSTFDPSAFWLTLLTLLSGAWTGLPPGESDPELLRVLPDRVVACAAWSATGTGQPGGPGVAGFAADPEVVLFLDAIRHELARLQEQADLPEEQAELRRQIERLTLKLATRPGCIFVAVGESIENADQAPAHVRPFLRLRAGIAVNAGPEIEAILADLQPLLRRLPGAQVPNGLEDFVWNPELPGLSLSVRRVGDRLLLGLGPAVATEMADRLAAPPNVGRSRLQAALAHPTIGQPVSFAFIDVKEVVTAIPRFIGLQGQLAYNTARTVGLDGLDFALLATSVVEGRVVQQGLLATTGPLDGVLAFGAGEALRPEHFAHVPADADLVLAGSLSFSRLHAGIRSSLQKSAPFMVPLYDQAIKGVEVELGFFIQDQLLKAFGDVWVVHTAPSLGGWTGNGAILSIPVREPEHARDVYGRLTEVLEQAFDEAASEGLYRLETETFLDQTLYVFRRLDGASTATPCVCLTDRHLYVAQHPLALKAQLRHAARPDGPTYAAHFQADHTLPEGAVGLLEIDSPALVKGVWARLPELAESKSLEQMYAGNSLFPIGRIPSAAAVLPYVAPTRGVVTRGETGGFVMEVRNPLSSIPVLLLQAWLTSGSDWDFPADRGIVQEAAPGVNAVIGAAAEAPAPAPPPAPAPQPAGAGLLKNLLPDNVKGAIPQAVFDRIAADAAKTPEQRQADRLERQRLRRERKQPAP